MTLLGPPGRLLGASRGASGASGGPPGGLPGASRGPPGGLPGGSRKNLKIAREKQAFLDPRGRPPEPPGRPPWGPWAPPGGLPGGPWGPLGGQGGPLGGYLKRPCAFFSCLESSCAPKVKNFTLASAGLQFLGLGQARPGPPGRLPGASGGPLGAPQGASWAILYDLGPS